MSPGMASLELVCAGYWVLNKPLPCTHLLSILHSSRLSVSDHIQHGYVHCVVGTRIPRACIQRSEQYPHDCRDQTVFFLQAWGASISQTMKPVMSLTLVRRFLHDFRPHRFVLYKLKNEPMIYSLHSFAFHLKIINWNEKEHEFK